MEEIRKELKKIEQIVSSTDKKLGEHLAVHSISNGHIAEQFKENEKEHKLILDEGEKVADKNDKNIAKLSGTITEIKDKLTGRPSWLISAVIGALTFIIGVLIKIKF